MGAQEHAVVVVGGGPTGMMLAGELALAGVDVAVVEKLASRDVGGSRAGGLHARTIEVLDQRGIAGRFLAEGTPMQVASLAGVTLDLAGFPTPHPYGLALWQSRIEQILAGWVAELPVTFHREREVTALAQDEYGVDVTLAGGDALRARYLVGCDGGRSFVRKAAGIAFDGWDASTSSLLAEVEMAEHPEARLDRDEHGVSALGPMGDGRTRVVLRDERLDRSPEPTLDELRAAIVARWGSDFGLRGASWISRFTDASRQAATYRDRRVLLAGDAAHIHAPVGGQGLNLGVQDAVNLGWKLARVVHGTSSDALLDSYHAERHPVAARVLRLTMGLTALNRVDDRMAALTEMLAEVAAVDAANALLAARWSGLDIRYELGDGHPLVGRRMPDLELRVDEAPVRVYELLHAAEPVLLTLDGTPLAPVPDVRAVAARYDGPWELPVLGPVPAPPAVLIRPDGHVAWAGGAGLAEALAAWA